MSVLPTLTFFSHLEKDKPRLDHRQYGVWYLEPKKWEPRFHQKSDQKLVKKIKSRRSGKEDSSKPSTELESADIKPEKDEEKLHAVRAFKSFLDRKTGYEAPPFLKKALEVPEDKWKKILDDIDKMRFANISSVAFVNYVSVTKEFVQQMH